MKILVVEDDLITRKLLNKILQRADHEVIEAENGPVALQTLDETKVDLIIADIMMPEMSGLEILRHLKKDPRTARTPVILCTTVSNKDTVLEAISLGISGYVLKPISASAVLQKVNEARKQVNPVLEDPQHATERLGVDVDGYKELLSILIENAKQRMQEMKTRIEVDDIAPFETFARELSTSAANLGAEGLREAALEASIAVPKVAKDLREKYLINLKAEIDRLEQAVAELA